MEKPVIYLAAVASPCHKMLEELGCTGTADLLSLVQAAVGETYRVEGDSPLIEATEDDARGGRTDDAERAATIERRLADDQTVAFVALRGGAWLTRILPRIDFGVLERRGRPVALFGFSELTTVLNIASAYPRAFCLYDLGPGFLRQGLRDAARRSEHPDPDQTAEERFPHEFTAFFEDVTTVLEGKGSRRAITGTLVTGTLSGSTSARFVGGNLAVFTALVGTPYAPAVDPRGRWLAFEDVNESPERVDRCLAQVKLAGMFERCEGLLIGDFHEGDTDHQEAVTHLLSYHLPPERNLPVITTREVGHVWPLAPLPLNSPVVLEPTTTCGDRPVLNFKVDWPTIVAPRGSDRQRS